MSFLIDEVARIVASPMPRRKALKLLGGTLSGALVATLSGGRAKAQATCSTNCKTAEGADIRCNANTPCEPCTGCCCNSPAPSVFGICVPGTPCGGFGCCSGARPVCCTGTGNEGYCCPSDHPVCSGTVGGGAGKCCLPDGTDCI
jgi:hypothetical protein